MNKNENVKDRIISVTIELIEQYGGDTKSITARMITEKAEVGLGLINYHFGSKDNLITECVQRIIGEVVSGFHIEQEFLSDKERLIAWAAYVFDFLFEHPAVSRISILGDFQNYSQDSNSVYTQYGFMKSLNSDIPPKNKPMLVFILTAAMQVAFLGSATVNQILGYDFTKKKDRTKYIEELVDILFEGAAEANE